MYYLIVILGSLSVLTGGFFYYVMAMPGESHSGPLTPLDNSAAPIRDNLEKHVRSLAAGIGERHFRYPNRLAEAARYIRAAFEAEGYAVESQHFGTDRQTFVNLQVELPGSIRRDEILLLGAHYDTVSGSPGADDNASGVAGLLEIARLLRHATLGRTVRLIAFANEEEPFSHSELMGSVVNAKQARQQNENIVAMYSLESLGYYSTEPGSQHYPPPLSWFYPDVGSFIAFVGNLQSRKLVRRSVASFRTHTNFPSEGIAAPAALIEDVRRSDHASFWDQGYPALMVTDTVPFRNPHYHLASDTPDRLDYDRLTRVVIGLAKVVEDLANAP